MAAPVMTDVVVDHAGRQQERKRHRSDRDRTDGPFAETAEMIGGFYVLDDADLDTVVEWCRILPKGYSLEIRPCISMDMSA